ncbi:MAG: tetratricopeptide repeat protein [Candidatus Tectomicrobia bacterium]|nr:tetratricopeptide repeat protein [Candidatus Tectomicrobia bacterium]
MRRWKSIAGIIALILASSARAYASPELGHAIELYTAQRYAESQRVLERVIAQCPQNATAHYYLGQIYLRLAEYDKAVKHCKKAVQLQADRAENHFCLGRSYGEKARHGPTWQQAVLAPKIRKALEKTVSLNPNHVQARLGLTHFYMRAPALLGGNLDKAYTQARLLVQLAPSKGRVLLEKIQIKLGMIPTTN